VLLSGKLTSLGDAFNGPPGISSLLGDFHLAEDAAQEAFVHAHARLEQLQSPAAFPQWFRRVVATRCERVRRERRLQTVPLDQAVAMPAAGPGPAELLARAEVRAGLFAGGAADHRDAL
jgi:DNA-directed RNA polymerase specialized sigma24 family protein